VAELDQTRETLEKLSQTLPSRIYNFFKLKSLRSELMEGKKTYDELLTEQMESESGIYSAKSNIESNERDIRNALDMFYEQQKIEWRKAGFNKELAKKYFTEEYLSSLNTQELSLLMSRFPSDMVTHVTRQGIRDHGGMMEHQTGKNEIHRGFEGLLHDGNLRSSLGLALAEGVKKETIAQILKLDRFNTKKEAEMYLRSFDNDRETPTTPDYADRTAIHVAAETVADSFYGAETGNEIFIAYPSLHVASQYFFKGSLNDEVGPGNYNDQWIWANEERGMSIDAGVIFIPKEARVNKVTGSRYELDPDSKPIVNESLITAIEEIKIDDGFQKLTKEYFSILKNINSETREKMLEIKNYLRSKNPIFTEDLLSKICNETIIYQISNQLYNTEDTLKQLGKYFVETSDPISSQEYWENYFAQGKVKRPSKIVYYEGENPSLALKKWKTENSLNKNSPTGDMGFTENRINSDSTEARHGLDRFTSIAQEIIDEYFEHKTDQH
jgi:hypothetical protein